MNLVGWVRDPVAIKELSGSARRWQTYAVRGVYVALFALIFWNTAVRLTMRSDSLSFYADLGRSLFNSFFGLQLGMVTLAAVSAASDQITKEIRAGTLSVLACSPLTPWKIALGKWKAAMAQTGTLLLCGVPVFSFCVYLGGATARDLTVSFGLTVGSAALGAAIALYFSTRFRSGITALLVSLIALAVYASFPALYMDRSRSYRFDDALLRELTKHFHLLAAMDVNRTGPWGSTSYDWAWLTADLATGVLVWFLLRRTAARIGQLALVLPGPSLLSRIFSALDRFYESLGPQRIRGVRLFGRSDDVWETRAVLWKELRTRATGRVRNSIRISLVLLLGLAGTFWVSLEALFIPIFASSAILWLMALANGASLFVTEKEERKWDVLLATPLSSADILTAKLTAGLVPLLPTSAIVVLFWTALTHTHRFGPGNLFLALGGTLIPAASLYLVGAVCSLRARSLRVAFLAAFSAAACAFVVLPMIQAYTRLNFRDSAWYSPLASLLWLSDQRLQYYVHPSAVNDALQHGVILVLIHLSIIVGLLTYLFSRFDRVSGRSG